MCSVRRLGNADRRFQLRQLRVTVLPPLSGHSQLVLRGYLEAQPETEPTKLADLSGVFSGPYGAHSTSYSAVL